MALSNTTFSDLGGAASDLFAGFGAATNADLQAKGLRLKAQGDLAEATNYDLAGSLAAQNEQFTRTSTAIKAAQNERETYLTLGGQRADVAGAGLAASGSALSLMAESASQGSLMKSVTEQQGLINEASYEEQQKSYQTLASAARNTAAGEEEIATETEKAGKTAEIGDFIGGALKGAAAIATLF